MTEELDERATALMLALAEGRDDALNGLMADWSAPLIAYLTKLTGSAATGEDLAQESFVRVYRHKLGYRPHQKFSTWLYAIATNLARNHHRWKQRHPEDSMGPESLSGMVSGATTDDPHSSACRSETMRALQQAITKLPDAYREALILSISQGMSHSQIARINNTSEKAVELQIYRARQILRGLMETHLNEK